MRRGKLFSVVLQAITRAVEIAKENGAKRSIVLPVSAPFHCALMAPAADAMSEALADITLQPPVVPVVANVTATPEEDPAEIRRLLIEQVTSRVRWRECILKMRDLGVVTFMEVGAGALTGMIRRIDRELTGYRSNRLTTSMPCIQPLIAYLVRRPLMFDLTAKQALVTGALRIAALLPGPSCSGCFVVLLARVMEH